MSSLLQFGGDVGRKGVHLEFQQIKRGPHPTIKGLNDWPNDVEPVPCAKCGGEHARIYRAWRKPVGMFGCWVVFRYNGEEHVPDLSIPIDVEKLPRDAIPVSDEENAVLWHRS